MAKQLTVIQTEEFYPVYLIQSIDADDWRNDRAIDIPADVRRRHKAAMRSFDRSQEELGELVKQNGKW